ncbi:hypothetical protein DXG01_000942 [Tephrocybe rancida]|nr:hypothetical protein DXG01_000942 [Tephrocybe rancida]
MFLTFDPQAFGTGDARFFLSNSTRETADFIINNLGPAKSLDPGEGLKVSFQVLIGRDSEPQAEGGRVAEQLQEIIVSTDRQPSVAARQMTSSTRMADPPNQSSKNTTPPSTNTGFSQAQMQQERRQSSPQGATSSQTSEAAAWSLYRQLNDPRASPLSGTSSGHLVAQPNTSRPELLTSMHRRSSEPLVLTPLRVAQRTPAEQAAEYARTRNMPPVPRMISSHHPPWPEFPPQDTGSSVSAPSSTPTTRAPPTLPRQNQRSASRGSQETNRNSYPLASAPLPIRSNVENEAPSIEDSDPPPAYSETETMDSPAPMTQSLDSEEDFLRDQEMALAMQMADDEDALAVILEFSIDFNAEQGDTGVLDSRGATAPPTAADIECGICMDSYQEQLVTRILGCHHTFCGDCLKGAVTADLTSRKFPIICPACSADRGGGDPSVIDENTIRKIGIPEKDIEVFEELQNSAISIKLTCNWLWTPMVQRLPAENRKKWAASLMRRRFRATEPFREPRMEAMSRSTLAPLAI